MPTVYKYRRRLYESFANIWRKKSWSLVMEFASRSKLYSPFPSTVHKLEEEKVTRRSFIRVCLNTTLLYQTLRAEVFTQMLDRLQEVAEARTSRVWMQVLGVKNSALFSGLFSKRFWFDTKNIMLDYVFSDDRHFFTLLGRMIKFWIKREVRSVERDVAYILLRRPKTTRM